MQIPRILLIHRGGILATIAPDVSPSRVNRRHSMKRGTSGSDITMYPTGADKLASVEPPEVLPICPSSLRSQVHLHPTLHHAPLT